MNMLMNATPSQTMSSLEIAVLCQKEHKNVTLVIDSLIDGQNLTAEIQRLNFSRQFEPLKFEHTYTNPQNNQVYPCFNLNH